MQNEEENDPKSYKKERAGTVGTVPTRCLGGTRLVQSHFLFNLTRKDESVIYFH